MVRVNVELDLPPGVDLLSYERSGDGHGLEVRFSLPDSCRCDQGGHEEAATYEYKNTVYLVCNLDLWGQPSFLIFQPCFPRCVRLRASAEGLVELPGRPVRIGGQETRSA